MKIAIIAFLLSFLLNLIIIKHKEKFSKIIGDTDLFSPQKIHSSPVPRIGGLPIFVGIAVGSASSQALSPTSDNLLSTLLITSLPVFLTGLLEDITKKISIKTRLVSAIISAALGLIFLDLTIKNIQLPVLGTLFATPSVSILFTCLAITGLTNSYNLIDGLNGLASTVAIITLLAIGYVAFKSGDLIISSASLIVIAAIIGFLFFNYPRGLIFLGDSGAYLIGFLIGILSILLITRNPKISPLFALIINLYPIFETIFTIWRRKSRNNKNPFYADGLHTHTLLYKRINHHAAIKTQNGYINNAKTSPYLWLLSCTAVIPGVIWWSNSIALLLFIFLFCFLYLKFYKSIAKAKKPWWLNLN